MAILNIFSVVFFSLTRVTLWLVGITMKIVGGTLRFVWVPVKGILYAVGFCVGIGLAIGVVVFLVNGGHLRRGAKQNSRPGCVGVTVPEQVCQFGGRVVRVINP